MTRLPRKLKLSLLVVGGLIFILALAPTVAVATHGRPENFPAYYDGGVITVLMGPSGNSANPNQAPSPCFGLGPDFSQTARATNVPLFYALFVPGATQMSCPDGELLHDMVASAIPGDPGYNAAVQLVGCVVGLNFVAADMPYTSAAEVEAGIAGGELLCELGPVLLSPVVGGH